MVGVVGCGRVGLVLCSLGRSLGREEEEEEEEERGRCRRMNRGMLWRRGRRVGVGGREPFCGSRREEG